MIKLIYGVKDKSSDCELIFPTKDSIGLSKFVNQSIIKNDFHEQIVGQSFYSIRCVDNFYVFSKIILVYDSKKRVSYRAYIIALEEDETKCKIFETIGKLESQYKTSETIQQRTPLPEIIKGDNNTAKNGIVKVYYNNQKEFLEYFKINAKYRQFETIYFIDEILKGKPIDPINALKNCDNVVGIETLIKDDTDQNKNTKKKNKSERIALTQNLENKIVIILFIILLGIGGLWVFQLLSYKGNNRESAATNNTVIFDSITTINTNIVDLQNKVQILEKSINNFSQQLKAALSGGKNGGINPGVGNSEITGNNLRNNEQLPEDKLKFLETDCKTMIINEIQNKIKKEDPEFKIGNYASFSNFLILIKKNELKKEDINNFISLNQKNFNNNDEYVKFAKYLNSLDNNFLTSKKEGLRNIGNHTFKEIETHYGYN